MRKQVEDAPLRFFFEHRKRIEEWYALGEAATALTSELLLEAGRTMVPPEDAKTHVELDEGGYSSVVLYRQTWWDKARSKPAAGVGFGWGRQPDIERPSASGGPWYGLWRGDTGKNDPIPDRLREACKSTLDDLGLRPSTRWTWFPRWDVMPPAEAGWYNDLPGWADTTTRLVLNLFELTADHIEEVVAG